MGEHILMEAYRASYDVVDIEKIQGEIRVLNANLLNSLDALNCVLNANSQLKEENKRLKKLIWDCHYLIRTGKPGEAAESIAEALNPEAIKRR